MGYTHYWTQRRNFTLTQWTQITEDLQALCKFAQHEMGIPLANAMGDKGTSPEFTRDVIAFNGLGDDSHESFVIERKRVLEAWQSKDRLGWGFCKTARKPYDCVVTAALCYLATIAESHSAESDGDGAEWLEGLETARRAMPRYANQLDIPRDILAADRWCAPWIDNKAKGFEAHFCVDGFGYVLCGADSYRFPSHLAMAEWLEANKAPRGQKGRDRRSNWGDVIPAIESNIWNATGSFDSARHANIARLQARVLGSLFPVPSANAHKPPAYVRPNEFPAPESRPYYVSDLLSPRAA